MHIKVYFWVPGVLPFKNEKVCVKQPKSISCKILKKSKFCHNNFFKKYFLTFLNQNLWQKIYLKTVLDLVLKQKKRTVLKPSKKSIKNRFKTINGFLF